MSGKRNAVTTAAGFSQLVIVYMYYKPSLGRVAVFELLQDKPEGVTTEMDYDRNKVYVTHPQSPPFV